MLARSLRILALVAVVFGGAAMIFAGDVRGVGDHTGFAPSQPIAFSHRLHAGELQVQCLYCHAGAERSRHAGLPEASLCMNCHQSVTAPRDRVLEEQAAAAAQGREPKLVFSSEIAKVYAALGLDSFGKRDPAQEPRPIEWVRVHHLPDFVYFDHRPHVLRGVACETCHGPVQSMDRVRQEASLSMGWCMECHRASRVTLRPELPAQPVSTDCTTCHF